MQIEFDTAKDQANMAKQGVSLGVANELDWGTLVSRADARHNYGEAREIGYAPLGGRLYCVVFVQRETAIRIISLRKANLREVQNYAKSHD